MVPNFICVVSLLHYATLVYSLLIEIISLSCDKVGLHFTDYETFSKIIVFEN